MSILTDILKEAPLSAVLQEKVKAVEFQRDEFKRELDDCRRLYQVLQAEHQKLAALHLEEIRVHRSIEFRRGKRTGDKWTAFCPKCHLPAVNKQSESAIVRCSDGACKWQVFIYDMLPQVIGELPN
jgi:hypothetical protein